MRKGFDGLSGVVRNDLGMDPLSGDVFIFLNRRRTHMKLLVWEESGFVVSRRDAFGILQAAGKRPV
jgi:transposase